jgi:hypothetical protein
VRSGRTRGALAGGTWTADAARMRTTALVCLQCGGPLGQVSQVPAVVECEFCGAVMAVGHDAPVLTRAGAADEARAARRAAAAKAFFDALVAALQRGQRPEVALQDAARAHLGAAGQSETVARVTLALARDFERESGVRVDADPMVLARIAQGYLAFSERLRDASGAVELNLPFLAADHTGPKHLARQLTPALIAELAQRAPDAAAPPARRKKFLGLF